MYEWKWTRKEALTLYFCAIVVACHLDAGVEVVDGIWCDMIDIQTDHGQHTNNAKQHHRV